MLVNNSDNHKQNCEFSEESVAYLYGESEAAQSAKFRSHLESCSACADELKAFSSIHSSIQNWKAEKFDILSSPIIEIPANLRQKSGAEIIVSGSWLTNLRERFSFSFGWIQAGALAALLISLTFGLYFLTSSGKKEIASDKTNKQTITETSPASDNKASNIAKSNSDLPDENVSSISENAKSIDSLTNSQVNEKISKTKKSASTKISTNRKNSETKEKSPKQLLNRKNRAPETYANVAPVNNRNLPKLNNLPEEAEDEDLRLADLFDEIDAG